MAKGQLLDEKQYEYFDPAVTAELKTDNIARRLIAVATGSPFGWGMQSIKNRIRAGRSEAVISMKLTENKDQVSYTDVTLDVPITHAEFELNARDLASSKRDLVPLDVDNAVEAAAEVRDKLEALILVGSDGYNGLYNGATNDMSTDLGFGTAGNGITAVAAAIEMLSDDNMYPPYNMVMNQAQYSDIVGPRAATSDKSEYNIIKDMLGGGAGDGTPGALGTGNGEIYVTSNITAGTAMILAKPSIKNADLVIAEEAGLQMELLQKSGDTFGRVRAVMIPRIKHGESICKLSDIGGA